MSSLTHTFKSSIGSKTLMAVTGMGLVVFAIVHMAGNLQVFVSPVALNQYAVSLRKVPALLWAARAGLIVLVLLHIASAIQLTINNRRARQTPYVRRDYVTTGYAARTMVYSGVIIAAFVVFHLAHYTFLWVTPGFSALTDELGRHDVHRMVVLGFENYAISALYIISVGLLCMHLSHGIPSFFQSLGLRHPKYQPFVENSGPVIAVLLFLGYAAVPVGVMLDLVPRAGGA